MKLETCTLKIECGTKPMLEHHSQPNLHKIVSGGLEQVPGGDLDGGVPAREWGRRKLKPAGLQHHPCHHRQRVPLQLQVINLLEAEIFDSIFKAVVKTQNSGISVAKFHSWCIFGL